jgi:hypothetical protein
MAPASVAADAASVILAGVPTADLVDEVIRLTHRVHGASREADRQNLRQLRDAARTEIIRRTDG